MRALLVCMYCLCNASNVCVLHIRSAWSLMRLS
jgi:hypothetical protein